MRITAGIRHFAWAVSVLLASGTLFSAAASVGQGKGPARTSSATQASRVANPGPPSLILITIDTWRSDYIGISGSGRASTPALDGLARGGVYEREMETPCPLTTPAHATILTGLLPTHHGVLDCINYRLPEGLPTLAQAFAARNYTTAAFLSSLTLSRHFGLDRGFNHYDDGGMSRTQESTWFTPERDGAETTKNALDFLRAQPAGTKLFVWVHYFDLHTPYRRRPPYDAKFPGNPYAAQVAFVDDQIATLLSALKSDTGRAWRILVVGDHGEGLGDHGETGHGLALYSSTLHVPLIIYPRPARPLPHGKPWRLEDMDATVRDWFDLPAQRNSDGESLFRAGTEERVLPSLSIQPSIMFSANPSLGVRKGSLMYIRQGVEELYDLSTDPREDRDLSRDPQWASRLQGLRSLCDRVFPEGLLQSIAPPTRNPGDRELRSLQSLGYIGGFMPFPADLQRVDTRILLADDARFESALAAYRKDRDPTPMQKAYQDILKGYPRAAPIYKDYGAFLIQRGDVEAALKAFDQAARLNPKDPGNLVNLGGLYLLKGKIPQAKAFFEAALAIDPSNATAHKNLGLVYEQYLKDPAQALIQYKLYLELGPGSDAQVVREQIRKLEGGK